MSAQNSFNDEGDSSLISDIAEKMEDGLHK